MVHTGRPSRGCKVCRKRRIKCDEKEPECSYCVKTRQKCPGYQDQFDLAWRDQTSVAQKNVERGRRASSRKSQDSEEDSRLGSPSQSNDSLVTLDPILEIIPSALKEDPDTYALGFFFSSYANPPVETDDRRGFLEHVGPQYVIAAANSPLKMATMAMSSFLFMAWLGRQPDSLVSRSFYLKAIASMQERVCQPEGCAENDVLTSVLLLQMYEVCLTRYAPDRRSADRLIPQTLAGMAQKNQLPDSHLRGALALIKHRGVENFRDDIDQSLLFQIRSQLIDDAFRRGEPVNEEVSTWAAHLEEANLPPSVRLDNINIDLADLEAAARQQAAASSEEAYDEDPFNILERARDIERRLNEWNDTLLQPWLPLRVTGEECIASAVRSAGLYHDYCHVYPSISITSTWNKYRISCIKVQSLIHQQLSQQPPSPEVSFAQADCETKVQQLADEICASIPFSLGDKTGPGAIGDRAVCYPHAPGREVPSGHYQMAPALGGFWLLGPLQMLMGLQIELRQGQKQWVGGQLMRIARIYNIKK